MIRGTGFVCIALLFCLTAYGQQPKTTIKKVKNTVVKPHHKIQRADTLSNVYTPLYIVRNDKPGKGNIVSHTISPIIILRGSGPSFYVKDTFVAAMERYDKVQFNMIFK